MKTQTIGELLQQEREKKKLSLIELSQKTRIRQNYLEALENNDFDLLPSAIFVKAYIKSYARVLGIDEKPLLAILRRDYEESNKGQLISREYLYPVLDKKQSWNPMRVVAMAAVTVFLVFFSYAAVQWFKLNSPPNLEVITPQEGEAVAGQLLIEGQTEPDVILLINSQPVALKAGGYFETELYLPQEGKSTITFKATDKRGKITVLQRTVDVQF